MPRYIVAAILVLASGLFAQLPRNTGSSGGGVAPLGPANYAIAIKTTTYLITAADYTIIADTTSGGFTVTLPATPANGQIYNVKKVATANTLVISGNGNTIDGGATLSITALNQSTTVQFLTNAWYIL